MTDAQDVSVELSRLLDAGDAAGFARLLEAHPDQFRYRGWECQWFGSAAHTGQIEIMAYLHGRGVDVNEPIWGDRFPREGVVDTAASEGHLEATRWLLDRGAVLNHTVDGHTRCFPLLGAASGGHLDVVQLLVERGAAVNARWAGRTALGLADVPGRREVYDYLVSVGAKHDEDLTVHKQISRAIRLGEAAEVAALLDDHPGEFRRNREPCVWLGRAAYYGQVAVLERLAERGAGVDEPVGVGGPLATAAAAASRDAAEWLLDNEATLNDESYGRTRCVPLVAAASYGQLEVIELLVDRGAVVNALWVAHTPLDYALVQGGPTAAAYLRSVGAKTAAELG